MPEDFSPDAYFAEYYGVLTDDTPMEHVVIRTYGSTSDYVRTLPLHGSQKELRRTDEYTDYEYDIRPTNDFINELFSYTDGLEVLEPLDLRNKVLEKLKNMVKRYE